MKKMLLKKMCGGIMGASMLTLLGISGPALAQTGNTCPSPLPTCTSSGLLSDFAAGTYACTGVKTNSDGQTKTSLLIITSNGAGSLTGKQAQNTNAPDPSTYKDFSAISATYCVNTDDTGYLTPGGNSGCPIAFVLDNGGAGPRTEARLIDSTENTAEAVVCKKQ